MRDRILSRVLFPAPFAPMMPTTSPTPTSKLTSRSAQKSVAVEVWPPSRRSRRHGADATAAIDSRKFVGRGARPIVYRLLTPAMVIASDDIGKPPFDGHEIAQAGGEQHGGDD